MKNAKPSPVPVNVVCSVCGEPWPQHKADAKGDVSTLECVRLLKARAELAERTRVTITSPVVPYQVQPYQPYRPYWISGGQTISRSDTSYTINCSERMPTVALASAGTGG